MKPAILSITCVLMAANFAPAAGSGRVQVTVTGQALRELPNAREAAVEAALRQAVEIGAGVKIAGETEVREFQLVKDVIYAKTAGLVETYKVLKENPNQDGLYTVRVRAIVSRADINTQVEAWKALIKRKGRPRIMVVGSVDRQPFDPRLTGELQGMLERRSLRVVDLNMLKENQRRDAERAARGDEDPQRAALISREIGADYFILAQVEGTKYSAQELYGIKHYPVDATGILKVIATDNANLLASEVVDATRQARTSERALRAATSEVLRTGLNQAIRRIAVHWLEDLDQRGGAEIHIVAAKFPFNRFNKLVQGLRAAGGIKDIIVDSTDFQGRSELRVVTNNPTLNLAALLEKLDRDIEVRNMAKYRIEIGLK